MNVHLPSETPRPIAISERALPLYANLTARINDARVPKSTDAATNDLAQHGISPVEVGIRLGLNTLEEVAAIEDSNLQLLKKSTAITELATQVGKHFNIAGVSAAIGAFSLTLDNLSSLDIGDLEGISRKLDRGDDLYTGKNSRII
jgi:hypothetical protein